MRLHGLTAPGKSSIMTVRGKVVQRFALGGSSLSAWFRFAGLSFGVGMDNRTVTVSGALEQGRVLLVRGPSGSGKTTLLRVLARLHPCHEGDVWLDGRHWRSFSPIAWRTAVCYVAQQPAMFEGTVRDNLARPFQLSVRVKRGRFDAAWAQEAMQALLLAPALLEQDARFLSGGEAARVAFIRALLADPTVLLLDEPTAALDREAVGGFCNLLRRWLGEGPERGAVLISHDEYVWQRLPDADFLEIGRPGPAENSTIL